MEVSWASFNRTVPGYRIRSRLLRRMRVPATKHSAACSNVSPSFFQACAIACAVAFCRDGNLVRNKSQRSIVKSLTPHLKSTSTWHSLRATWEQIHHFVEEAKPQPRQARCCSGTWPKRPWATITAGGSARLRSVECVDSFRRLLGAIRPNESWVYLDASEPTVSGQDAGLTGAGLLAWALLGV